MTEVFLTLQDAAFAWPDGQRVFSHIDIQLDRRHTGLVGRNGAGKSVLGRVLAGELEPTQGRCLRTGRIAYVAQQVACPAGATVASIAGVQPILDALNRIEAGEVRAHDFETVGDRWDIRQRLPAWLDAHGLGHHAQDRPAAGLSGGELTRIALAGAWLAEPDMLVLDEPTNHLDRPCREALMERLRAWPKGLLVISHDRELLQSMQRILELSPTGLRDYGGGYDFYAHSKMEEQDRARQELGHRKAEQRRGEAAIRQTLENLRRRQSRATHAGRDANQAAILLGRRKQQSQVSTGKRQREQDARREELARNVRNAALQVADDADISLLAPAVSGAPWRKAATLDQVRLPFGAGGPGPLDLTIGGCQRIGVMGANGSGKSTLLKVVAGRLAPASGQCEVHVPVAFLDQQLEMLDPGQSPLQHLLAANPSATEAAMRTRLAQLALPGDFALKAVSRLSGGERLKAALACALYGEAPAELLVLDEPTNHLDLQSLEALEQVVLHYRGALVVASHDRVFLDGIALDHRLEVEGNGFRLLPW